MSLDTLLGFPEGYLSRLADALSPLEVRDEAQAASDSAPRRIRAKTPSSMVSDDKNTVGDAKNPRISGEVKA